MSTQSFMVELLLSGFFAIACLRARAESALDLRVTPRSLFVLTDRLERLRRSRWQWFAMILLLVLVRVQRGGPIVAEVTVLAQFALFIALPSPKVTRGVARNR